MKYQHFIVLLLCCFAFQAKTQETYSMKINGKDFPVELSKSFTYITESGDSIIFQIDKTGEAIVTQAPPPANTFQNQGNDKVYEDLMIKFAYPEQAAVSTTQPTNGMQQITMINGNGAGIFVQEYSTINPKDLVDFYLTQLVGDKATRKAEKVNISLGGQKVNGKFARDEDGDKVVVYSYGKGNQGILLALIGDDTDDATLRNFVQSFELKF